MMNGSLWVFVLVVVVVLVFVHLADIIRVWLKELPADPKFEAAKRRIAEKYDAVERNLIEEFNAAHRRDPADKIKMKSCAASLSHFKGKFNAVQH